MRLAQLMGSLLFVAGLVMVVVSVLSTLIPMSAIGDFERVILFLAGVLTLALGYYMTERA